MSREYLPGLIHNSPIDLLTRGKPLTIQDGKWFQVTFRGEMRGKLLGVRGGRQKWVKNWARTYETYRIRSSLKYFKYQGVKNFTRWLIHLTWAFSPHVAILTLCSPCMVILTLHSPHMAILTWPWHSHLTSTLHGYKVTLGMCMLSCPLLHTKSPHMAIVILCPPHVAILTLCGHSHFVSTLHGWKVTFPTILTLCGHSHLASTSHGHEVTSRMFMSSCPLHLTKSHCVAILTLCPPCMGILAHGCEVILGKCMLSCLIHHTKSPHVAILTLHGHSHLMSTLHGHEVALGGVYVKIFHQPYKSHLVWASSPWVHLAYSPPCKNNIFHLEWKNSQKVTNQPQFHQ